jgi:hypothetical protein
LPLKLRSYNSGFDELGYKAFVCPYSHFSSGKKIWSIRQSIFLEEEWSCGTAGCSYQFVFFEKKSEINPISERCVIYRR